MATPSAVSHHELIRRHDEMHRRRMAANTRPSYFTWTSHGHRWHSEKSHVFRACVNCRKGHVACDVNRPCRRCILGGKVDTCIDVDHRRRGRRRAEDELAAKHNAKSTTPTAQSDISTSTDKEIRSTSHSPRSQAISPSIELINSIAATTTSNSATYSNNTNNSGDINSGPIIAATSSISADSRFQPYSINRRRASLAAITTTTTTTTETLANSRHSSIARISPQLSDSPLEETSDQMVSNQQRHSVEPPSTDPMHANRTEYEMKDAKETPLPTNYNEPSYSHDGMTNTSATQHYPTDTRAQPSSINRTDVALPLPHPPHPPRNLSPPSPNASHMTHLNDVEMKLYTSHAPVELPPLMDGPPLPVRHKLPAILSSSKLSESFGSSNADATSEQRPSLPPLASLTTGLSTSNNGSSVSPLPPTSMSHNMPPNSSTNLASMTSTPSHVPLTPSHSGGRDYFPPVPNAPANSITVANNATSQNNSASSMLSTMVIILTFMDLRVVRVSDESLNMLGHHPMLFANKSFSELLHRTDRPKLAVLREWLRWVVCSASGLSDVHLTRFPGNITSPVFQRSPTELIAPAQDWPPHIIIEDNVHFRVLDGEYRQFRIRLYVGGPGVRVGHAETWENACVVCEVRRHTTPTDGSLTTDTTSATSEEPVSLSNTSMNQQQQHNNSNNYSTGNHSSSTDTM
ncbi:hypothetical protein BDF22DRAFT_678970 [Syncephalis plumigaleata]|nr:hypothetical protein BDF22DRAFT_678970 [Syncephalis plumigaleata]